MAPPDLIQLPIPIPAPDADAGTACDPIPVTVTVGALIDIRRGDPSTGDPGCGTSNIVSVGRSNGVWGGSDGSDGDLTPRGVMLGDP